LPGAGGRLVQEGGSKQAQGPAQELKINLNNKKLAQFLC
jgi:hypothetical protein